MLQVAQPGDDGQPEVTVAFKVMLRRGGREEKSRAIEVGSVEPREWGLGFKSSTRSNSLRSHTKKTSAGLCASKVDGCSGKPIAHEWSSSH